MPAWITGGLGVDAACERVVDALPEAPAHRRVGLCAAFLKATRGLEDGDDAPSANPGLAVVAASLLTRARGLEAAAEASARARAAKAARRAAKEGGAFAAAALEAIEMEKARAIETASAWVGNLVATLLARETATAAVRALVRVAEVRCDEKPTTRDATKNPKPTPNRRRSHPRRVSLMIHHFPCQDSDALLFVERRVETFSSAAFLLRDYAARVGFWVFGFLGFGFSFSVSVSPKLASWLGFVRRRPARDPTDRRVPHAKKPLHRFVVLSFRLARRAAR